MDPRLADRRRNVAETRIRRGIRRLLVVLLVVGLAAASLAILRSGLFSLDRIETHGESQTDPVAMVAAVGVELGVPLIEIDLDEARAAIEEDPRVVSAEVGRRWPTGLEIEVVERFGVAWVDRGQGWEHLAADGVVLASGEPDAVSPRIRSTPQEDRAVEAALQFVDALVEPLRAGMVIDARTAELNATWNGLVIRLGRPTDMVEKARALEVVVADEPVPGSEITLIAPERPAVLPPTTSTTSTTQPEG
ncbi:MAG: FtsQ-type POTRA domain-containing protein [Acidimicrobiia bacterium]